MSDTDNAFSLPLLALLLDQLFEQPPHFGHLATQLVHLSTQLAHRSLQSLHPFRCPPGLRGFRTPFGSPFRLPGKFLHPPLDARGFVFLLPML